MLTRFVTKFLPRQLPADLAVNDALASMEAGLTPVSVTDLYAQALGFVSQSSDLAGTQNGTAPTAGTVYASAIWVPPGAALHNLHFAVNTAGAGTAPTAIFGGLADWSGQVVAQSANVGSSAMWTSVGLATLPLAGAPYAVSTQEGGLYYALFLQVGSFGTTAMKLARPVSWGGLGPNGVLAYGTTATGQTALPANGSQVTVSSGGQNWWAGLS